ncbi:hypothetical protein U9890_25840, partial [Escherichia coli]
TQVLIRCQPAWWLAWLISCRQAFNSRLADYGALQEHLTTGITGTVAKLAMRRNVPGISSSQKFSRH